MTLQELIALLQNRRVEKSASPNGTPTGSFTVESPARPPVPLPGPSQAQPFNRPVDENPYLQFQQELDRQAREFQSAAAPEAQIIQQTQNDLAAREQRNASTVTNWQGDGTATINPWQLMAMMGAQPGVNAGTPGGGPMPQPPGPKPQPTPFPPQTLASPPGVGAPASPFTPPTSTNPPGPALVPPTSMPRPTRTPAYMPLIQPTPTPSQGPGTGQPSGQPGNLMRRYAAMSGPSPARPMISNLQPMAPTPAAPAPTPGISQQPPAPRPMPAIAQMRAPAPPPPVDPSLDGFLVGPQIAPIPALEAAPKVPSLRSITPEAGPKPQSQPLPSAGKAIPDHIKESLLAEAARIIGDRRKVPAR